MKNPPEARRDAARKKAGAEYNVAREKCDDLSGNAKDVCVKDAKAARSAAGAHAK